MSKFEAYSTEDIFFKHTSLSICKLRRLIAFFFLKRNIFRACWGCIKDQFNIQILFLAGHEPKVFLSNLNVFFFKPSLPSFCYCCTRPLETLTNTVFKLFIYFKKNNHGCTFYKCHVLSLYCLI